MTIEQMIAEEIPLPPDEAMPAARRILDRLLSCRVTASAGPDDDRIVWQVTTRHNGVIGKVVEDTPEAVARWNRLVRGGRCA